MRQELKEKMLTGKMPVAQLELKYIKISEDYIDFIHTEKFICDQEKANHVIDWFECPECGETTYFKSNYNFDDNMFETIERIENESKKFKCIHQNCNIVFTCKDNFVYVLT